MHFFFYYIPQRYFKSLHLFSISTATIFVHIVIISSWSTETVSWLVTLLPFLHSYNLFSTQNLKDQLNPEIRSCSSLDYYDCRLPVSLRWKPELCIIPRRTPSFLFASPSHNTHSLFHYIPIVLLSFLCLKQSERAHWCIFVVVVFAWNAHPCSHHIYLFLVCSWNFHSTVTITQKAFLYHAN